MKVIDTPLPDVKLIEPAVFADARGFFLETWSARSFARAGIAQTFVQDNRSRSAKGVLRGLHYQVTKPQGKLVTVMAGRVLDVVVDIRKSSPDFGRWWGTELSEENKRLLWVPPGFAHGFLSLEDGTDLVYKCTEFYEPEFDRAILWRDPAIGIAWPLDEGEAPLMSPKDLAAPLLADAEVFA